MSRGFGIRERQKTGLADGRHRQQAREAHRVFVTLVLPRCPCLSATPTPNLSLPFSLLPAQTTAPPPSASLHNTPSLPPTTIPFLCHPFPPSLPPSAFLISTLSPHLPYYGEEEESCRLDCEKERWEGRVMREGPSVDHSSEREGKKREGGEYEGEGGGEEGVGGEEKEGEDEQPDNGRVGCGEEKEEGAVDQAKRGGEAAGDWEGTAMVGGGVGDG